MLNDQVIFLDLWYSVGALYEHICPKAVIEYLYLNTYI